ncbi:MAG TPA: DUF4391 domain-containing protein [Noviherbaspirillum sp.]
MTEPMPRLFAADLIAALGLPPAAMVNQRVPKKMLAENGASTVADRKLIQDHIEEITWVAALKPASAGVLEYKDDQRIYLELAVLCVTLRSDEKTNGQLDTKSAKVSRIAELLHRAIPYPLALLLDDGNNLFMSLVHIRWAQKEADKTVLDGELLLAMLALPFSGDVGDGAIDARADFLSSLALSKQPRHDLRALYQGWMDTLSAWQAAAVTGRFVPSQSPAQAAERRAALHRCRELDAQIASLRLAAGKEKQMARQVAANLEIKALLAERQQVAASL